MFSRRPPAYFGIRYAVGGSIIQLINHNNSINSIQSKTGKEAERDSAGFSSQGPNGLSDSGCSKRGLPDLDSFFSQRHELTRFAARNAVADGGWPLA